MSGDAICYVKSHFVMTNALLVGEGRNAEDYDFLVEADFVRATFRLL
jgi:hypothetical protein